ncbi:MAG: tetratricopeptide repeat protein [Candidatus Sericytochromatia bacterium]|nr:tetratricopeptide repeat protein [Candidatus Sericytochromatia bacterium]
MDFSAIASIQQTRQQLENRRQNQAEALMKTAFEAMRKAFDPNSGRQKRQFLQAALEAFGNALQQQRSNPEIYIGLAYLLISMQEFAQAYNYLQEGQRLAPDHPDIEQMLAYLKQRSERIQAKPVANTRDGHSGGQLPSEDEYDELYDKVESQLQTALAGIQSEELPTKPTLALSQSPTLAQLFQDYQQLSQSLQRDLRILHSEFDTAPLEQQLVRLNLFLKRCQGLLAGAEELTLLYQALQGFRAEVKGLIQAFSPSAALPPVDDLLDRCDAFADQLDEYERKGYALKELLESYEALVEDLENLQNLIDEQAN